LSSKVLHIKGVGYDVELVKAMLSIFGCSATYDINEKRFLNPNPSSGPCQELSNTSIVLVVWFI